MNKRELVLKKWENCDFLNSINIFLFYLKVTYLSCEVDEKEKKACVTDEIFGIKELLFIYF